MALLGLLLLATSLRFTGPTELFEKGRVSTASSEIRVALSPDGTRMLWGSTNRPGGPGGWDLWESRQSHGTWSQPAPVPFDSPENDFDPFVASDGVYFFSNRPGGLGGDDLYVAPFDSATGRYGPARNLGPSVNSKGDEWAPTLSADGATLLFASDGRGGLGLHDLFTSARVKGGWSEARPLAGVNGPDDDFDAAYLHDGRSLVLTRKAKDQDGADLYFAAWQAGRYAAPVKLGPEVNEPGSWNLGPAIRAGDPGVLYFSSARAGNGAGRMDVYRVSYALDAAAAASDETLMVPGFGAVTLYAPAGPPEQVVLFVSGDGGWRLGVVPMAERLRGLGALVAGVDIRAFLKTLESGTGCAYPAGALEELSRAVQLHAKLPAYKRPILAGYSSGATLVYGALVAAPPETFAGAISLGFCPDLDTHKAPCRSRGLAFAPRAKGVGWDLAPDPSLALPWKVLQGEADQVCEPAATAAFVKATGPGAQLFSLPKVGHGFSVTSRWDPQFVESYRALAAAPARDVAKAAAPSPLDDLSLVEVPASEPSGDAFAVILTGDGGWAEIDKGVAAGLAGAGVPVVGWSSLRYFWTPRTPEAAAADLGRIVEHYAAAWKKSRVLLVGYSFGADALPFLASRLAPQPAARVASLALLGLSPTATFEFHVSSWLGGGADARYPTRAEIEKLQVPVLCVHGEGETDSACPALRGPRVQVVAVGSGHHFGGEYERIAKLALGAAAHP